MSEDVEDEMLFENGKSMSYYIALLYADDGVEVDNSKVPTLINLTKNPFQDALDQRIAVAGVADGVTENLRHRLAAEFAVQRKPPVDAARHRHR